MRLWNMNKLSKTCFSFCAHLIICLISLWVKARSSGSVDIFFLHIWRPLCQKIQKTTLLCQIIQFSVGLYHINMIRGCCALITVYIWKHLINLIFSSSTLVFRNRCEWVPNFSVYNPLLFTPWKAWCGVYNKCGIYIVEVRNCKRTFFYNHD